MRTNTKKILGAVAVAGLVATGGSAFTAGGFSTSGATGGFVGGKAAQSIVGATLSNSAYTVVDNKITSVKLTFGNQAALVGKAVTVSFDSGATTAYPCGPVASDFTTTCTAAAIDQVANTAASLNITVAS